MTTSPIVQRDYVNQQTDEAILGCMRARCLTLMSCGFLSCSLGLMLADLLGDRSVLTEAELESLVAAVSSGPALKPYLEAVLDFFTTWRADYVDSHAAEFAEPGSQRDYYLHSQAAIFEISAWLRGPGRGRVAFVRRRYASAFIAEVLSECQQFECERRCLAEEDAPAIAGLQYFGEDSEGVKPLPAMFASTPRGVCVVDLGGHFVCALCISVAPSTDGSGPAGDAARRTTVVFNSLPTTKCNEIVDALHAAFAGVDWQPAAAEPAATVEATTTTAAAAAAAAAVSGGGSSNVL